MFSTLKDRVQKQFDKLAKHTLYRVDVDRDILFNIYLDAFPVEERQGYTCNCCKHYLRTYGGVVAIIDGKIHTMWDFEMDAPYAGIPANLGEIVRGAAIKEHFLSDVHKLGTDFNHQHKDGEVIRWEHFYYKLPNT